MTKSKKGTDATENSSANLDAVETQPGAGHWLIELYDMYVRFLSNQTHSKLMNLNLTQWRTLTLIRGTPDQTQRAVASAVGIDPSSMTPIIDLFEGKGWVRRHKSTSNRSAYGLRMTPAGLKAYRLVENEIARTDLLFAKQLGAQNHKRLIGMLKKLHDTLENDI